VVQAAPFIGWFRKHFGVALAFADWEQLHITVSGMKLLDLRSPLPAVEADSGRVP
jgi:hypothetical protein